MNTPQKSPTNTGRCEHCHEKRYVTGIYTPHGSGESLARATICDHCHVVCARCDDEGFIFLRDERGYRYASPCPECAPLRRRVKAFNDAQLPARYREKTFEHFDRNAGNLQGIHFKLFQDSNRFVPGDKGFLLYGEPGSGKTHLMSAFLHRITLEKGVQARFVEFTHLLSTLRQQFDIGRGDTSVIQPLIDVDVLAIDELGKGVNNEWQLGVLDELISRRYNLGRTTLFTSNYLIRPESFRYSDEGGLQRAARETLSERIGDRIFSRLFEMTDFIQVDAPDFRKRKLKLI